MTSFFARNVLYIHLLIVGFFWNFSVLSQQLTIRSNDGKEVIFNEHLVSFFELDNVLKANALLDFQQSSPAVLNEATRYKIIICFKEILTKLHYAYSNNQSFDQLKNSLRYYRLHYLISCGLLADFFSITELKLIIARVIAQILISPRYLEQIRHNPDCYRLIEAIRSSSFSKLIAYMIRDENCEKFDTFFNKFTIPELIKSSAINPERYKVIEDINDHSPICVPCNEAAHTIATIERDSYIVISDALSKVCLYKKKAPYALFPFIGVLEDKSFVVVSFTGKIYRFIPQIKQLKLIGAQKRVVSCALHSNKKILAVASKNKLIYLWNIENQIITQTIVSPHKIKNIAFSCNGAYMLVHTLNEKVSVYDIHTGYYLFSLPVKHVKKIALDQNNEHIITYFGRHCPQLWNITVLLEWLKNKHLLEQLLVIVMAFENKNYMQIPEEKTHISDIIATLPNTIKKALISHFSIQE